MIDLAAVDADREADVLRLRRVGDRGVDPDDLAVGVHERTTRVARVDGGVGLQHAVERRGRSSVATVPVRAGDDALGDAQPALERERVADRDDLVADLQRVGVAELDRRQARRVDLQHREVGRRVVPEERRGLRRPVGERDLDLAARPRRRGCW